MNGNLHDRVDDFEGTDEAMASILRTWQSAPRTPKSMTNANAPRECFGTDNWYALVSVVPERRDEVSYILWHPDGPDSFTFPEYYAAKFCGVGETVPNRLASNYLTTTVTIHDLET